jgi:NAD(P)-dependent dehydrogenase (short-subunit alcohol dehydrogenase family)
MGATVPSLATDRGAYVVTGAGSGIGLALTRALLAEGCRVAAWDIAPGGLAGTTDPRLTFTEIDVRDKAAMTAAATSIAGIAGGIAGLSAGAGVMELSPFLELTEEAFDRTLAVNLKGAMLAAQTVLPTMRAARYGSIVMYSSMLARTAGLDRADYIASKGGILGLARSLALELAAEGIRVNTISPAIVDTPMPWSHSTGERMADRARSNPMGRIGKPADIVDTALFLLSDDASFITAQDIRVSGGDRLF